MSRFLIHSIIGRTALVILSTAAFADSGLGHGTSAQAKPSMADHGATHAHPTGALAVGTVRALDAKNGQMTIAHGPLASLGMGAMTTAFRVRDPSMLGSIKAGQKVRFAAQQIAGAYTLTQVEAYSK